ncbi:MAG: hypothetical protein AB7N65_04795 [Vicinamibacterales bacterium]
MLRLIRDHVTVSNAQVTTGIDPGLPMESDALRAIFRYHADIRTTVEPTATGIAVTFAEAMMNAWPKCSPARLLDAMGPAATRRPRGPHPHVARASR